MIKAGRCCLGIILDMNCLPQSFYLGEVTGVARALLGKRLVRQVDGRRISGIICETEAYRGEDDLACHAHSGKTRRNEVMYGLPGRAYVYFTYGMHWCLNTVCGEEGYPAAVLIRAILPEEGLEWIAARRAGVEPANWCNGPAKLTKALGVDGGLNGTDPTDANSPLFIEEGYIIEQAQISTSPRVGIQSAPEPWRSMPWRFTCSCRAGA